MDEIHESSPREIQNSTIIAFVLFCTFSIFLFVTSPFSFDRMIYYIERKDLFLVTIGILLFIIMPIASFITYLNFFLSNKKSKYKFVNYKIAYQPFYNNISFDKYEIIFSSISYGIFTLLMFSDNKLKDFNDVKFYLFISLIFLSVYLYKLYKERINFLDSFPVEHLHKNKIRIIFGYEDYLNNKIVDNDPRVYIGQNLRVSTIEFPRNEKEKYDVKILNDNTLDRPALVTTINSANLRSAIDNGYTLEAKIVNIHEFAQLEIEFYLRNDNFQFVKIDPDYEIKS
jgi:hypothetical protein